MITFLVSVDGDDGGDCFVKCDDCFVKCDDCRGLHNILDDGLISDTIILCRICSERNKKRMTQRVKTITSIRTIVLENVKPSQACLDKLFWSKKGE